MSAPYRIGAGVYEETHPRLEIRDLYKKREQFTLFILAWQKIRTPNHEPVPARYEEIAGIHGMPYVRWPGDPYDNITGQGGQWLGYCNHESILFPNWHRPYVMLLEHSINQAAQGIAGEIAHANPKEAEKWLTAARELRFPFWDWTLPITGEEGLPEILYTPKLKLLVAEGVELEVDNILASYTFNKTVDGFDDRRERQAIAPIVNWVVSYYKQWKRTYRWPSSTPTDTQESIDKLNEELTNKDGNKGSWKFLVHAVSCFFNFPLDISPDLYANAWDEFSNTTFQSSRPDSKGHPHSPYTWKAASLEQPHDLLHLVVGGSGHMSDNDTAGFDPIFYLHHCNVDRLWAFWEQVYPDYVAGTEGYLDVDGKERRPFVQSGGTLALSSDQAVDGKTGLLPFRKSNNLYWNSSDTQFTNTAQGGRKYYTYPDTAGISLITEGKLSLEERSTQRAILQKYFGMDLVQLRNKAPSIQQRLFTNPAKHALAEGYEPVNDYRHFVITTSLSPTAFSGSYIVRVSLLNGKDKLTIGAVAVLARGNSSKCENCQLRQAAGARVRGVIVVPHEVMANFIEQRGLNTAETESKAVIDSFTGSLHVSIILPSGRVQAEISQGSASEALRLSDSAVPLLELHSANVSALQDSSVEHDTEASNKVSPQTPYEFYDWKNHGSAVQGSWIKVGGAN